MEETILRFRYNIYRESKLKARLCQIGICIGVIAVIFATAWWIIKTDGVDVINNVIASFVGVAALFVVAQLVVWILHHNEDKNKVSYRNQPTHCPASNCPRGTDSSAARIVSAQ